MSLADYKRKKDIDRVYKNKLQKFDFIVFVIFVILFTIMAIFINIIFIIVVGLLNIDIFKSKINKLSKKIFDHFYFWNNIENDLEK